MHMVQPVPLVSRRMAGGCRGRGAAGLVHVIGGGNVAGRVLQRLRGDGPARLRAWRPRLHLSNMTFSDASGTRLSLAVREFVKELVPVEFRQTARPYTASHVMRIEQLASPVERLPSWQQRVATQPRYWQERPA